MLEQKLAEANRAAKRKRILVILVLVGAASFVGLFFAGYLRFDGDLFSTDTETVAEAPAPSKPAGTATPRENESASDTSPPKPAPAKTTQESVPEDPANREAFKDALTSFDQEFKLLAESDGFRAWSRDASADILAERDNAVSAFGAGEYAKALSSLEKADNLAREKRNAHDADFDKAYDSAIVAYQQDEPEAAALNITEALRLKPDSEDATELKGRIDRLPEVLDLINQAVTARVENALEREAELLRKIVALDDSRIEQKERLGTVLTEIRENRYAEFVSAGMTAAEKRDLATADKNLQGAAALFPSRDAVKLLSSQVATLRQELEAESLLRQAVDASVADDWVSAQQHFASAQKILPNNKDATDGVHLATKIIGLKTQMTKHLSTPGRLSNAAVQKSVEQLIADADAFKQFSPSLQSSAEQLSAAVQAYSQPVPIMVISDGKTHVSVRGVGQVGQTTGRTINMKPGSYTFEGKRKGYVSVLVKVDLKPGAEGASVEVICNDPV